MGSERARYHRDRLGLVTTLRVFRFASAVRRVPATEDPGRATDAHRLIGFFSQTAKIDRS